MDKSTNERIRALRRRLNLTQMEFAKSLDITQEVYADVEKGESIVSGEIQKKLLQKYDVNISWLKQGVGEIFIADKQEDEKMGVNYDEIDQLKVEIRKLRSEIELSKILLAAKDRLIDYLEVELRSLINKTKID